MVDFSYTLSYECLEGGRVACMGGSLVDYVTLYLLSRFSDAANLSYNKPCLSAGLKIYAAYSLRQSGAFALPVLRIQRMALTSQTCYDKRIFSQWHNDRLSTATAGCASAVNATALRTRSARALYCDALPRRAASGQNQRNWRCAVASASPALLWRRASARRSVSRVIAS